MKKNLLPTMYIKIGRKVLDRQVVSFVWNPETIVNIALEALPDKSTLVKVTENGKVFNQHNLKWVLENTAGWANFLACMKAYLEYGIPLCKGAFEFYEEK
jgi:hypothetical protein